MAAAARSTVEQSPLGRVPAELLMARLGHGVIPARLGLRINELAALQRGDVDLTHNALDRYPCTSTCSTPGPFSSNMRNFAGHGYANALTSMPSRLPVSPPPKSGTADPRSGGAAGPGLATIP